jgi:hypothetical protein
VATVVLARGRWPACGSPGNHGHPLQLVGEDPLLGAELLELPVVDRPAGVIRRSSWPDCLIDESAAQHPRSGFLALTGSARLTRVERPADSKATVGAAAHTAWDPLRACCASHPGGHFIGLPAEWPGLAAHLQGRPCFLSGQRRVHHGLMRTDNQRLQLLLDRRMGMGWRAGHQHGLSPADPLTTAPTATAPGSRSVVTSTWQVRTERCLG